MRALHAVNAACYFANAVAWFVYAHVPMMGCASLLGVGLAVYLAKTTDTYRYR